MTYCKNCGTELPTDANYCPKCGNPTQPDGQEEFTISSDDLVKTVKQLIHEGNVRRIIIKDEHHKTLLDIPVTIGVVGLIIAPWLAALGVIAAMVTRCTIIVIRKK